MAVSKTVKAMLDLTGIRQIDLANAFDMTKQSMSNKMARDSWSASDLAKAAKTCGCELVVVLPNGTKLTVEE